MLINLFDSGDFSCLFISHIAVFQVYTGVWMRHYMPLKERMIEKNADRLGQVSVSNATRRRLAGSGN